MSSAKQQAPLFHIGDWVKFDYGPKKVSAKVVEDRGRLGVHGRRLYRVQLDQELGDASSFEMPENELDATPPPVRQSYEVRYIRQGKTNIWRATTRKSDLLRGVKAEGAVGYSTALREGEREDDQMFATVTVLLEVDPQFGDAGFQVDPQVWREMAESAGALADEMFRSRHPRARVEHAASA
ncbi:MAG: hypothetical protein ACHRXM_15175 [Isosphaerales bacterium]